VCSRYPDSIIEARQAYFQAATAEVLYKRALVGMLVLSIFEMPAWCGQQDVSMFSGTGGRCASTDRGDEVMLSGLWYIPPGWGIVVECILMGALAKKFIRQQRLQVVFFEPMTPRQEYYKLSHIRFGLAMLLLELADCVFFVLFKPRFRLAFLARTGYLCLLPAVVNLAKLVYSCLWEFFSIASFLIGAILLFAWIAVMIFDGVDTGAEEFRTFPKALNSMFVAGVSEDFVAVFLQSYTTYRWVGLLWLIFLVIAHVLLLSLVLDTLTAAYMLFSEEEAKEVAERKVKGILKVFKTVLVATTGAAPSPGSCLEIPRADFLQFIKEYGTSPKVDSISEERAEIMFQAIDKDNSRYIDYEEFCGICRVIQYRFWCTRRQSVVASWFPGLWNSDAFQRYRVFVEGSRASAAAGDAEDSAGSSPEDDADGDGDHPELDRLMNCVLVVNLCLVVAETACDLNKWQEPPSFESLELVFSLIYLGEVFAKLSVVSFGEYWSYGSNQFDLFSTVVLLVSSLLERIVEGDISTYANMLRLLRLLRVVKNLMNMPSVKFMVKTISKLLATAQEMVTLLGVVLFFFTNLSVQVLGGELYEGNKKLEGTEWLEEHWIALNCNDVPMAFGVWVVTLLSEYQPKFPDAVAQVSSFSLSWTMFPIFYVVGVSIVFELVKAFTIEVFVTLYKGKGARPKESARDVLGECKQGFKQALAVRGEVLHYSSSLNESAQEAMQEAFDHLDSKARQKAGEYHDRVLAMLLMDPDAPTPHHGKPHSKH